MKIKATLFILLLCAITKAQVCFTPAVNYTTGSLPTSVHSADFNSDGNPDLAVTNKWGNNVSVFLGNGTGTLGTATNFNTGLGPYSVISGDYNADTKTDLIVANYNSNTISFLAGTGTGSFNAAVNFSLSSGPISLASADFNGDSKKDIAVAVRAVEAIFRPHSPRLL